MTGVLNRREEFGHRHTRRMPCDSRGKVGVGARTAPRIASNPTSQEEQGRVLPVKRGDTLLLDP